MEFLNKEQVEASLAHVMAAPKNHGCVKMIVSRPRENERNILQRAFISLENGMEGDSWKKESFYKLENGDSHPDAQITLTNYRFYEALVDTDEKRALAGDNLFVDLDLSISNLSVGQQLRIGEASALAKKPSSARPTK